VSNETRPDTDDNHPRLAPTGCNTGVRHLDCFNIIVDGVTVVAGMDAL
jgi:hypothetical protein